MAIDDNNVTFGNFGRRDKSGGGGHNDGGNGSGGGGMEERIRHLESNVDVIKATMATKEDIAKAALAAKEDVTEVKNELLSFKAEVHSLLRQQIMWSVGTIIATGGLVFAIMRFTSGS